MTTDTLFRGLFDSDLTEVISPKNFLLCLFVALVLGALTAASYMYRSRSTKSFAVTLLLLPAVVCVVIMMVNGNVGTGVAVAGAFSLVRFRSVPGTAKEICALFLAMGMGLICGMGYLAYAALFTVILCAAFLLLSRVEFGASRRARYKTLTITIPEDLDYTGVFEDIFAEYFERYELVRVKTVDLGSLFRLTYEVVLSDGAHEKEMIDRLRTKNGNLEISLARCDTSAAEL